VIGKPYTERAVANALAYVARIRSGAAPAAGSLDGLSLAPRSTAGTATVAE